MDSTFTRLLGWRLAFGLGVLVLWEVAAGRFRDVSFTVRTRTTKSERA